MPASLTHLISKLFFTSILVLIWNGAKGQDSVSTPLLEQKIENIAENTSNEESDFTNLLEQLEFFKDHKINLTKTSFEELAQLQLLNDIQLTNFFEHIRKNGDLISIYELQAIEGFDRETILKILPYVKLSYKEDQRSLTLSDMIRYGSQTVTIRSSTILEKQKGYIPTSHSAYLQNPNSRYLGSPYKIYSRYRYLYGNLMSFGITAEKDPGEEFFMGTQKSGFDFYSAHFFLKPNKIFNTFALGDYTIGFGQGLVMWSGISFGKSSDVISIKKNPQGIRPYLSTDENLFLRGIAATSSYKNTTFTGFISRHAIDANVIQRDEHYQARQVSSLQETGYHTTWSEINDKHAITQTVIGGNINLKTTRFKTGITYSSTLLSAELNRYPQFYNQFYFSGKKLDNASADYSFILRNFNFFGEGAVSLGDNNALRDAGYAFLNGMIVSVDPRVAISLLHRNYQRNYHSFFSDAFGENTTNNNENGLYSGIEIKILSTLSLNAYYDQFSFPWLKYEVNAPSRGNEYMAQLNYQPNKKMQVYLRYRNKNKLKNYAGEDVIDHLAQAEQSNYRLHASYQAGKAILLKSRIELIEYLNSQGIKENGSIIYQDLIYKNKTQKLSVSLRYALFSTPSYDSRIYTYESDIPGAWSIPAYYYNGSRYYIMLNYNFTKAIECWVRYSQNFYANKNIISEGYLSEIQGNKKSELKAQMNIKF